MLSEAFSLLQALKAAGIELPSYARGIESPGRTSGPCIRVRTDANGVPVSLEAVADDDWPGLWTRRDGNQNSRPVVRLSAALLDVSTDPDDDPWTRLGEKDEKGKWKLKPVSKLADAERRGILSGLLAKAPSLRVLEKRELDGWKRLTAKLHEDVLALGTGQDLDHVRCLLVALATITGDPRGLADGLLRLAGSCLASGTGPSTADLQKLMIGDVPSAYGKPLQLAFDVSSSTVYTRQVRARLEQLFGGGEE